MLEVRQNISYNYLWVMKLCSFNILFVKICFIILLKLTSIILYWELESIKKKP